MFDAFMPDPSYFPVGQYCFLSWDIKVVQIFFTPEDTICCPYVEPYVARQNCCLLMYNRNSSAKFQSDW